MAWLLLFLAGLLEVVWAIGLKYADGFTRLGPTLVTGVAMVASVWLLGLAVRTLPIGTAYAVWVGIGAVGTAVLGIVVLGEPAGGPRIVFLGLLVVSLVGLRLTTTP